MSANGLVLRRVAWEQRTFWRNLDAAFFSIALPLGLLVMMALLNSGQDIHGTHIRYVVGLVPGILMFGLVNATFLVTTTTLVRLREEGVLKRLRGTPLSAATYLGGLIGSTLVVAALVTVLTVTLGRVAFGVGLPLGAVAPFVIAVVAGSLCFCAVGCALSAFIRSAGAASPVTNAAYLPLFIISSALSPAQLFGHSTRARSATCSPSSDWPTRCRRRTSLPTTRGPGPTSGCWRCGAWAVRWSRCGGSAGARPAPEAQTRTRNLAAMAPVFSGMLDTAIPTM